MGKNTAKKNKGKATGRKRVATSTKSMKASTAAGVNTRWLRLLNDPCGAPIVPAPYEGVGSGFYVRTVNIQPITVGGLSAAPGAVDFITEFTPYNFNTPLLAGNQVAAGAITLNASSLVNFITNSSVVKTFRCIACCAKWIPLGTISSRSGVIGRNYSPARTNTATDILTGFTALQGCAKQDSNGSVRHEVKWLPAQADERFSSTAETNIAGAGSCTIVGINIDCTSSGTAPNIIATANGYLEYTCVWEWEPHIAGGGGVAPSADNYSVGTVRDTLSRIRNLGHFLYDMSPELFSRGYDLAVGAVGAMRGPSMPRLTF